jgi:hypothetical protein
MKLSPYALKLLERHETRVGAAPVGDAAASRSAQGKLAPEPECPAALDAYPLLMTVQEVAEYFAICDRQVVNLGDEGQLSLVNIGIPGAARSAWRVTRSSVAACERRRLTKPSK